MSRVNEDQLRPATLYKARYDHVPRGFGMPQSDDRGAWERWRSAFRDRLETRLGESAHDKTPVALTPGAVTTYPGYERRYVEYRSAADVRVPAWLLVPTGITQPVPAVIAVHGHGYGMDDLVGITSDGKERVDAPGYQKDFARALCLAGMVVLVPELRGFGRRREPQDVDDGPETSSCQQAGWWAIMVGKTLLGSRVWDVQRGIDLLQSLPEVDGDRIGMMGTSGGGAVTMFAAALDERLQAVVICNYFCSFRDSILALKHCSCNYVPGLLQDGEAYDIAALIAPRPLLIVSGKDDPIFPLPGVLDGYQKLADGYRRLGVSDRIEKDIFVGGHEVRGERAYGFLKQWLGMEAMA
ncbi:MAG: alpha/beta hydrolase family protein [Herpetosiphon sp.]